MSPRPAARAVWIAAGMLAAAVPAAASGPPQLVLSGPRWVIAGSDARFTVTTSGTLATSRLPLIFYLAVDGAAVARVEATGTATRVSVPWQKLTAGRHEILVRTGTFRATRSVEVLPRRPVWLAAGLAGLALGATLGLWHRHRRRRATAAAR